MTFNSGGAVTFSAAATASAAAPADNQLRPDIQERISQIKSSAAASDSALENAPQVPAITYSTTKDKSGSATFGTDPDTHRLLVITDPATQNQINERVAKLDAPKAAPAAAQPYSIALANPVPQGVQQQLKKLFPNENPLDSRSHSDRQCSSIGEGIAATGHSGHYSELG
jgi:hypothetical protein